MACVSPSPLSRCGVGLPLALLMVSLDHGGVALGYRIEASAESVGLDETMETNLDMLLQDYVDASDKAPLINALVVKNGKLVYEFKGWNEQVMKEQEVTDNSIFEFWCVTAACSLLGACSVVSGGGVNITRWSSFL